MRYQAKRQELPFSTRMVACYRDWKELLVKRGLEEKAYWVLVDDLCTVETHTSSFNNSDEVLSELSDLLDICHSQASSLGHHYAYTEAKLRQSITYLTQTEIKKVTRADTEARGVKWISVTDAHLDVMHSSYLEQREAAEVFLRKKGEDPLRYYNEWMPGNEAAAFIKKSGDEWVVRFQEAFSFIPSVQYDCIALDLEMPFQNLVVYKPGKFSLLMNTRTETAFTRAHLTFLSLHEICGHIVHFTHILQSSSLQKEAPQLLPIAIHTQDSFVVEGIAQLLSMIVYAQYASDFPQVGAQIQVSNLYVALRHANISDLIENKITPAAAATRHAKYLGGTVDALEKFYAEKMNDTFSCIQALNYYSSIKLLSPYLKLNRPEMQKSLAHLMSNFFAPNDVELLLKNLQS